jgi:ParB-like chromosome segregation protein Spo0J
MKLSPIVPSTGKLEPHELSLLFPAMKSEDVGRLAEDIKRNGLYHPIVLYQDKILDGVHRYQVCSANSMMLKCQKFEGTDAEAKAFVISSNFHRRHLTNAEKQKWIDELLKLDPSKSDRAIAASIGVDNKTVNTRRERLEATEEIPQLTETTGADGKKRKRAKTGKGKSAKPKTVVEFITPHDPKTATNAYSVLEEHLLDALQDVNDKSSFGHATEYADRTKEKLEEKLSEMQPETAEAAE